MLIFKIKILFYLFKNKSHSNGKGNGHGTLTVTKRRVTGGSRVCHETIAPLSRDYHVTVTVCKFLSRPVSLMSRQVSMPVTLFLLYLLQIVCVFCLA